MSARPQVTITLGRSGQVVKRAGPITDSDCTPSSEGKRPIRERLGDSMDSSYLYGSQDKNKRQRTENSSWSSGHDRFRDDKQYTSNHQVGRHDLRFKLLNKSLSRRNNTAVKKHNEVDLREKLSRSTQVSLRYDAQKHVPESRGSGLVRRIPPTRSADDLLQLASSRKSDSSWTLDGLRRSPPDRLLGASRGLSPPRNYNEMRHVSSIRSADPSRSRSFMTNGVVHASRPTTFMSKPAVLVEATKPALRAPPPGGIIHKSSYMSEERVSVASMLNSLGLGKYAILFQAEEVDMTALKQMGDRDLKELGIPMAPVSLSLRVLKDGLVSPSLIRLYRVQNILLLQNLED